MSFESPLWRCRAQRIYFDFYAMRCFARYMLKHGWRRFVWLSVLWMLAIVFSGCVSEEYVIIASSSHLPSAAQVEEQIVRESIPPDLRKRLKKAIAESQAQAANVGTNRQYLAQMPSPQQLMEKKLLETVLQWAGEKPSQERLVLQQRRSAFEAIVEESRDPDKPETTWRDNRHVQYGAGVAAGAAIGTVPLGPYAADVAIELKVLPGGTYYGRVGKCAGELISGVIQMAVGCSGMTTGIGMTGTGGGAPAGVVVISASFALAANGYATTAHALEEAQQLWKEGPPPDAPASSPPEKLLKPKTRPKQPATTAPSVQAAPAKPAPQTQPAKPVQPAKPPTTTVQTQAGADVKPKAKDAPTTVYRSINETTGEVLYVGITNDLARRQAEHMRNSGFRIVELLKGLTRSDAKAVEQALIEMNGLGKNGGTLLNKINSIAKTNPAYAQQVKRGYDLLESMPTN